MCVCVHVCTFAMLAIAASPASSSSSLLLRTAVTPPARASDSPRRARTPACCICINCKLVDQCKVYHWVEKMHEQPHVTEQPPPEGWFNPKDPQVQVFIRSEDEAETVADGGAPPLTTEYDVFECDAFTLDQGKWLRLMPDAEYIPT